jgi:hypothetical protein
MLPYCHIHRQAGAMNSLGQQVPPRRFYPSQNRKLRIVKWLALVGGLCLLLGGAYETFRKTKIRTEGVRVSAKLVEHGTQNTLKGKTFYRVLVDFCEAEGMQVYRMEFFVSQKLYEQTVRAGMVPITFLVQDPSQAIIGDVVSLNSEPFAIGIVLILLFVAVELYGRRNHRQIDAYIRSESRVE